MKVNAARVLVSAVVGFFALTGCGPDQAQQVPSAPLGAIAGKVTSLKDGTAMANVKVSVLKVDDQGAASELSATTAADGTFSLSGLPAGTSYRVRFAADGFVARFRDVTIPAAAGDFPQGNGVGEANIAMAPATAGINGKLIASGAKPAAGAKLGVDLRGANFDFVAEATADNNGNYTFTGLPGAPTGVPITVVVQPYDEDHDSQADYGVLQVNSLAFPNVSTRTDIDLREAASALVLLASDVDDGEQPSAENIRLVFNRAVVQDRLDVGLEDLDTNRSVGVSAAIDAATGTQVTLTVAGGKLAEGTHYQLTLDAYAANGASATFTRYFRAVSGASTALPAVTGLTATPDEVDWNTSTFDLRWNMVAGAQAYRVYVRDSKKNPAFALLKTVGAAPNPQTSVQLPAEFDAFTGDGQQTPFAFNTSVDIAVVAVNSLGDAPAPSSTSAFVHKLDNVSPKILSAYQTDGADNTDGASPKQIDLRVSFSEYIDVNNPPQISVPSGVAATFEADATLVSGKFVLTIPAGVNGSGTYQIAGGTDTSGNALIAWDGTLNAVTQLLSNGGFEGCSLNGWNPTTSSTASFPVATSSRAASGTCSARLGNQSTSWQGGTSAIYQQVTLPTGVSNITFSARYWNYSDGALYHDYSYCSLQNQYGSTLLTMFSDYTISMTSWATATYNLSGYAGQTVRIYCASYQDGSHNSGVYFDDLSLTVTP